MQLLLMKLPMQTCVSSSRIPSRALPLQRLLQPLYSNLQLLRSSSNTRSCAQLYSNLQMLRSSSNTHTCAQPLQRLVQHHQQQLLV